MSDLRRRQLNRRPDRQAAALAEDRRHGVTTYPIVRRCWCLEMRRAYHQWGQTGQFKFYVNCATCSPWKTRRVSQLKFVRLATEGGRTYGKASKPPPPWFLRYANEFTWRTVGPIPQGAPVYVNDAGQATPEPDSTQFIGYAVQSSTDGTINVTIGGA